jgi:hypothetical protein
MRDDYQLVHSRCDYKVLDVYTIANVIQDYYSNAKFDCDVDYVFPLPPGAAVCSFQSILDDEKVIKGIVKAKAIQRIAKGQGEEEHPDNEISQGNFAAPEQEHANGDLHNTSSRSTLTFSSIPNSSR